MIAIVSEPSEEIHFKKNERESERENGRCENKTQKSACLSQDQF
jgi:hypothetical protein